MNEKDTAEYLKKLEHIKLTDVSREKMRTELSEYVDFHAIENGVRVVQDDRLMKQVPKGTTANYLLFGLSFKKNYMHLTLALLITAMVGGGTSFAAERAVPGDVLYPVKIEVNEAIKSAFAVSNESEAKLQVKLLEQRLYEAESLSVEGRLDQEASASLRARLQTHYDEVTNRLTSEENVESRAVIRASLEGTLRSYADILSRIDTQVGSNNSSDLITDINTYAENTAILQATATKEVSVESGAEAEVESMINRAHTVLISTKAALGRSKSTISADSFARIEAHLSGALTAEANANTALREARYAESKAFAQEAIRIASEVEVMVASARRLNVDLDLRTKGLIDLRTQTERDEDTSVTEDDTTTEQEDTASETSDNNIEGDTTIDSVIKINASGEDSEIRINSNVDSKTRTLIEL